ncbi:MAG: flagellar FliJ family protein [Ilumatobacteraceae bacterium]
MNRPRGEVVVRVRSIVEDIAAAAAAAAQLTADAAADAATIARQRAATHPLSGSDRPLAAADLMTAVGLASALRETALSTQRRSELADQSFDEARREVHSATASRKAAERLVKRRIAAVAEAERRRLQRSIDENAAGSHRGL